RCRRSPAASSAASAAAESMRVSRLPSDVPVLHNRRGHTDRDADDGAEDDAVRDATGRPADDRAKEDARRRESEEDTAGPGELEVGAGGGLHLSSAAYLVTRERPCESQVACDLVTRVVFVHGSVAGARRTWAAQRPLAERFECVFVTRGGYPPGPLLEN